MSKLDDYTTNVTLTLNEVGQLRYSIQVFVYSRARMLEDMEPCMNSLPTSEQKKLQEQIDRIHESLTMLNEVDRKLASVCYTKNISQNE
ncbi:hypothetical protein [Flectobacillus roseus]|uniref:hypothetical protein n=1 Tax=Flectobacillus roseus TaxID=502259 RepID=UPI0024B7012D|nr:hypothetical protein [Flectobacillus roseus]MDI9871308.1 hypothetical protein [Flectobacillus roseus]